MIEALKELVGIIKELPHIAVWILAGLLFYKVAVIGSIYGVIRLAIEKWHDYLIKPKEVIEKLSLDGIYVTGATKEEMTKLLHTLRKPGMNYVHIDDIEALQKAMEELRKTRLREQAEREQRMREIIRNQTKVVSE